MIITTVNVYYLFSKANYSFKDYPGKNVRRDPANPTRDPVLIPGGIPGGIPTGIMERLGWDPTRDPANFGWDPRRDPVLISGGIPDGIPTGIMERLGWDPTRDPTNLGWDPRREPVLIPGGIPTGIMERLGWDPTQDPANFGWDPRRDPTWILLAKILTSHMGSHWQYISQHQYRKCYTHGATFTIHLFVFSNIHYMQNFGYVNKRFGWKFFIKTNC